MIRESTGARTQGLTLAQLLCAFAYASDLAFGLQLEDTMRSAYLALRLAQQMDLPDEEARAAYYTALLKDAGCTSWTTELATAWQTNEIVARRELLIFSNARDKKLFMGWMRKYVAVDQPAFRKLGRYCSVLATSRGLFTEGFATSVAIATRIAARLGVPGRGGKRDAEHVRAVGRWRRPQRRSRGSHPNRLANRPADLLPDPVSPRRRT